MRISINTILAIAALALITSCNSDRNPSYQYFPNMYESVGYEAYSSHEFFENLDGNNSSEALKPVNGTVHRGWLPYDYVNSPEGYANAKANLKNPLPYTKDNESEGMQLYTIYCAICHGDKGNGKGYLVEREKILGVPSYDDIGRAITEGSIYHVMYYGINSMGSYASQTSIEERWQIVQYVQNLKAKLEGKEPRLDKAQLVARTNEEAIFGAAEATQTVTDTLGTSVAGEEDAMLEGGDSDSDNNQAKNNLLGGKSHHSHKTDKK